MASDAPLSGATLLHEVERLAGEGLGRKEIAERLGFKSAYAFNHRLVKSSQQTGKPIPAFRSRRQTLAKRTDLVRVRQRGRGQSFGVNVPKEPLEKLGLKPGDRLTVEVRNRRIFLAAEHARDASKTGPRPPRLIKKNRGR